MRGSINDLREAVGWLALNYPPSFLFRYIGRLVRSLVYLPDNSIFPESLFTSIAGSLLA